MSNPWFNDEQMGGHSDKPAASPPSLAARKFALPPLADSQEAMEGIGSDGEINSATPPVCPTCHDTRDTDVPCSNAFHIASLDAPAENVGVVMHGSLVPEESPEARLAIAAANCISLLVANTICDASYQKSALQVEAELRDFASKQPPAPTLSEVIEYRREMERLIELRSPDAPDTAKAFDFHPSTDDTGEERAGVNADDEGLEETTVPEITNEALLTKAKGIPSDSGELERALDEHSIAAFRNGRIRESGGTGVNNDRQLLAARKSVLDLFERLQNRIAELERMLAGFDVSRSEEDHGIREAASIGELEADRARLDWLIESGAIVDQSNESAQDGEPWMLTTMPTGGFGTRSEFYWGATSREVIDKARLSSLRSSSLGDAATP